MKGPAALSKMFKDTAFSKSFSTKLLESKFGLTYASHQIPSKHVRNVSKSVIRSQGAATSSCIFSQLSFTREMPHTTSTEWPLSGMKPHTTQTMNHLDQRRALKVFSFADIWLLEARARVQENMGIITHGLNYSTNLSFSPMVNMHTCLTKLTFLGMNSIKCFIRINLQL